jgi:hypothetical protein
VPTTRVRFAACAIAAAGLLSGCARFNAALSQQWVVVQLAANTSVAAARHVTAVCSHVPGMRAAAVRPTSPGGIVGSVRFNATRASDADMARLQQCLQRFRSVQGLTLTEAGDN